MPSRQERGTNLVGAVNVLFSNRQSELWTALPGIIQSFDPAKQTVVVQPTIQALVTINELQDKEWVDLPVLLDCPVFFPSGGGVTLTFPVKVGDECLVVFSSRCIDAWWQNGGVQVQAELRMHDLSDGFAFAGFTSNPRTLAGISTTTAQLRTDTGGAKVELNPVGEIVNIAGTVVNITGTLIINGTPYLDHTHDGVQTGGGNTGGVNP